jgi:hypothetical protein
MPVPPPLEALWAGRESARARSLKEVATSSRARA